MADGEIILRKMTCRDLDQVIEIENKCFSTPWTREAFSTEMLKNICAVYVVAEIGRKVVGYGGMWIIIDEAHITNVAVDPEYRNKGLGSKIVRKIIETAKLKKAGAITLEVRESNLIAQKLYTNYGFIVKGRRKKYYSDNKEDALIMWNEHI